nr:flagellar hook-length control protein FliK [uncultured Niameybacter sp.]
MDQMLTGLLMPKETVQIKETNYKNSSSKDVHAKEVSNKESFKDTVEKAKSNNDNLVKSDQDTKVKKVEKNLVKSYEKIKRGQSLIDEETIEIDNKSINVEGIESLLMELLTTKLSVSEETIEQVLSNQGITLEDLTNQETFRTFVMEVLGQDEMSLLNGQGDIKAVTDLWDQIQTIQSVKYNENQVVTEEVYISQDEVVQSKVTTVELPKIEEVVEQVVEQMPQLISNEKLEGNTKSLKENLQKVITVEGSSLEQMDSNVTDLGMTLPIQGVLKEGGLKYWQTSQMANNTVHTLSIENPVHAQMLEKIHYANLEAGKELEMQLTPKELGKLTLKMVEQNGVLTAQIKVEQDKTKELILENLAALKEGLEKQGLVIKDVQVEVRKDSHQTQMEMGKHKSTKRIQDIISKHMNDVLEEEQGMIHTSKSLTSLELDYEA